FDQCIESERDAALLADARHNLELAKQLWRRLKSDAVPPESDPQSPPDPTRPDDPDRNDTNDPGKGPDGSGRPGMGQPVPVPGGAGGAKPTPADANPGPGAGGTVSPLTSDEQSRPLPPDEARELLRRAAERITRERRALQHAGASEVRPYPDW